MKVYVSRGGRTIGPVSLDDARQAIEHQKMKPADLVSIDGRDWARADEVPELSAFWVLSSASPAAEAASALSSQRDLDGVQPVASTWLMPIPAEIATTSPASYAVPSTPNRTTAAEPPVAKEEPISRLLVVGVSGLTLCTVFLGVALAFSFRISGEMGVLNLLCYGIPAAIVGMGAGALVGAVLAALVRRLPRTRAQWGVLGASTLAMLCVGCCSGFFTLVGGGGARQHTYTTGMDLGGPNAAYWGLVTCTEGPYGTLSGSRVSHGPCPTESRDLSAVDNHPVAVCRDGASLVYAYTESAAAQVRRDCSEGEFSRLDGTDVEPQEPAPSAEPVAPVAPAAIVGCWSTEPDNPAAPAESYGSHGSYHRLSLMGETRGTYTAAPDNSSVTIRVGTQVLVYSTMFDGDAVTFTRGGSSSTYRSIPCR